MTQSLKRITAGFLVFLLVMTCMPLPVQAAKPEGEKIGTMQMAHVNPLEQGKVTEEDLLKPELWVEFEHPALYADARDAEDVECYYDIFDTAAYLRDGMEQRKEVVEVGYITEDLDELLEEGFMDVILALALMHSGYPTQGDYLFWQLGGASGQGSIYQTEDGWYAAIMTFQMSYYTTYEQEMEVTEAVHEFIDTYYENLNREPYYLIKTAYKYICDNVTYDYDNLDDTSYMLKHTAYAAMIDGTAVCQGYALLLYRIALELGVDCRLIPGVGGNEPHGWNIININGTYYNADATWDAGMDEYTYFLVSDENFPDHDRDPEYETADFYEEYPMGSTDCPLETPVELEGQYSYRIKGEEAYITRYLMDKTDSSACVVPKLLDAHTVTTICEGAYAGKSAVSYVIHESIHTIEELAFANNENTTEIYFEGDAPAIGENAFEGVTATAYYPNGNDTWTEDVRKDYGGTLTWKGYCQDSDHDFVLVNRTEPTCEEAGEEHYRCSYCDKEKTVSLAAPGHDWNVAVLSPGEEEYKCKNCGELRLSYAYNWFEFEGHWYFRKEDKTLAKGWFYNQGGWYYFDGKCRMVTGWLEDDGKTYYLDSAGRMKTGWLLYKEDWYYFTGDGVLKTGWLISNGIWYYMDAEDKGAMYIGWLDLGEDRYYLDSTGGMKTGWLKYDGEWYYFDADGVMVKDQWVGDSYLDENGVWVEDKVK